MKLLLAIVVGILGVFSIIAIDAEYNGYHKIYLQEVPIVNIPEGLRQRNWAESGPGDGSCTWASIIPLLRWQQNEAIADHILKTQGGGETINDFMSKLDKIGVVYATGFMDKYFLEEVCRLRLGAVVGIHAYKETGTPRHAVTLVGTTEDSVCLLDNNDISEFHWIPREIFFDDWMNAGGIVLTPVYSPIAPLP